MSSIFIFNNEEESNSKINIDELYEKKQRRDLKQISILSLKELDMCSPVIFASSLNAHFLPISPHRSLSSGPTLYHSNNASPASSKLHLSSKIYGVNGEP